MTRTGPLRRRRGTDEPERAREFAARDPEGDLWAFGDYPGA